ncbi:MAG: PIG-L family deacetylase [Candidatus Cloacimonetes bacterium]|nr:PIG-L family deacetylase [Candidatus Cloacimonadota bacterium]
MTKVNDLSKINKAILAITAHPDDHISFAGTVLKLKDKGYKFYEVVLSDGEEAGIIKRGKRMVKVDKREQLKVRKKEFEKASKILGTEKVFRLHLANLNIQYSKESLFKLMKIIREIRPEIAFIHHPKDYMHDHIAASYLSLEALKTASYSFALNLGQNFRVPMVFLFEGVNPINPDVLVDISDYFDKKMELAKVYGSQMGSRSFQLMESAASFRGYFARVKYAEAFEVPENYPIILDWR